MRTIPEGLAAGIAAGASRHALCWKLTRADGMIVGVTDHDRALEVGGVTYEPSGAMETVSVTARAGLAPDRLDARGALSSEAITEADLLAGLWDGARVDVYRADWESGDAMWLWAGQLTGITRRGAAFEAELVSLKAALETVIGRVVKRRCDARLGDVRCGVDVEAPEFAGLTCDQRFATCRDVFGNVENFRGFPDLPGNDALVSGPEARRDGGSRRRDRTS